MDMPKLSLGGLGAASSSSSSAASNDTDNASTDVAAETHVSPAPSTRRAESTTTTHEHVEQAETAQPQPKAHAPTLPMPALNLSGLNRSFSSPSPSSEGGRSRPTSSRIPPPLNLQLGSRGGSVADLLPETARQLNQLEECRDVITEIRPFLLLSGKGPAKSEQKLSEARVSHVVNLSSDHIRERFDGIEYTTWNMLDSKKQSIGQYFYPFISIVEKCRASHGRLLVHCHVGASRSCALVIAYLMWSEQTAFKDALDHVKSKRSVCNPNISFMSQLINFEARLKRQRGGRKHCAGDDEDAPASRDGALQKRVLAHPIRKDANEHRYMAYLPSETPSSGSQPPLAADGVFILAIQRPPRGQSSTPTQYQYVIWVGKQVSERDAKVFAARKAATQLSELFAGASGSVASPIPVVESGTESAELAELLGIAEADVPTNQQGGVSGLTLQLGDSAVPADAPTVQRGSTKPAAVSALQLGLATTRTSGTTDMPRPGQSRGSSANSGVVESGEGDDSNGTDNDNLGPVVFCQLSSDGQWEQFKIYSYDDLRDRSCMLFSRDTNTLYCWRREGDTEADAASLRQSFLAAFPAIAEQQPTFATETELKESQAFLDAFNSGL